MYIEIDTEKGDEIETEAMRTWRKKQRKREAMKYLHKLIKKKKRLACYTEKEE